MLPTSRTRELASEGVGVRTIAQVVAVLCALASASAFADAKASPHHVIYLHGRIVQDQQSARPRNPKFGYYELEQILAAFRNRGFVVSGGIRPKSESVSEAADRVVAQVRRLLDSGVPAERISVVGASMGGGIALVASARLQNLELRFCVLGVCLSENDRAFGTDRHPAGRLLAIREASDDLTSACEPWKTDEGSQSRMVVREIVLNTGLGHGFLYGPLPEWLDPVLKWVEAP